MAINDFATLNLRMNTAQVEQKAKRVESTFKSLGSVANKVFAFAGISIGTTLISKFGKEAIKAASDAQEIFTKFDAVFDENTESANKAANSFARSFGLAESSAKNMLSASGDLLSGFGFTDQAALDVSTKVNQLAVDLASFTNFEGGATRASIALTKALLGETESAKALGVVIRQDSKEYKELVKNGMENENMTLLQAKAMASLNIAISQSKNAIGDYARTQDGLANIMRRFDEEWKSLKESVGDFLIEGLRVNELFKESITWIKSSTKTIREMDDSYKTVITRSGLFAAGIGSLIFAVKSIRGALALKNAILAKSTISTVADTVAVNANTAAYVSNSNALKRTAINNQYLLNSGLPLNTQAKGLSSAFNGVGRSLGSVAAIGTSAFVGWQIGRAINKATGLDKALTTLYGNWFYNLDKIKNKGKELDDQLKKLNEKRALNSRGLTKQTKAPIINQEQLAIEKQLAESRQRMDEMIFSHSLQQASIDQKINMLHDKRVQLINKALNATDAIEASALYEKELSLKFKIEDLTKQLENQKIDQALTTFFSDLDAIPFSPKIKGEEKSRMSIKATTPVLDAVQKGSVEAFKIQNTTLQKQAKIETNTQKTANNTNKMAKQLEKIATNTKSTNNNNSLILVDELK